MDNYILLYWQGIQDGTYTVGKWIWLFYKYIVEGLETQSFFFDQKKANKAIRFIEKFCHHCKGRNDLLKLEVWQKAAVSVIFGIVGADGLRWFTEVVIVIGRKNGKSLFAAAIIACVLILDREYGAEIYCVAPKLDQADIVYSAFVHTVKMEPELGAIMYPRKSDYFMPSTNSFVKKIAFNEKKADGYNPLLTVCDEIASWPGQKGLRQYEVMTSGGGSRDQPLTLAISTSGYENEGIYDELINRCTRMLLGGSREEGLAPLLYMVDDLSKWNDLEELKKANPNYGVSLKPKSLERQIKIAESSLSKKAEFITKFCCIKQNSSQAWLPEEAVRGASGPALSLEDFRGSYCVGGIDLSRTTDLTAAVIVIEKDGKLYVFARFWMPTAKIEESTEKDNLPYSAYIQRGLLFPSGENFVDYHDCFNWFRELVEVYQIYPLQVGFDRYCASYLVQDMKNYGFHMDDVYQGFNLSPVIQETEGLIKDGAVCIGDNDLLKIHLLDMAVKADAENGKRRPVKLRTGVHIDGGAALLDAMTVRQKYYSEIGDQLKNGA